MRYPVLGTAVSGLAGAVVNTQLACGPATKRRQQRPRRTGTHCSGHFAQVNDNRGRGCGCYLFKRGRELRGFAWLRSIKTGVPAQDVLRNTLLGNVRDGWARHLSLLSS